jgi:hypothetical protein
LPLSQLQKKKVNADENVADRKAREKYPTGWLVTFRGDMELDYRC